jgi:hypothetical protein
MIVPRAPGSDRCGQSQGLCDVLVDHAHHLSAPGSLIALFYFGGFHHNSNIQTNGRPHR